MIFQNEPIFSWNCLDSFILLGINEVGGNDEYRASPKGGKAAQAPPQAALSGTVRANLTGKLAIHSAGTILIPDFGLLNPAMSASFSLDTGSRSFPWRTSVVNLSIKYENASSVKTR